MQGVRRGNLIRRRGRKLGVDVCALRDRNLATLSRQSLLYPLRPRHLYRVAGRRGVHDLPRQRLHAATR